MTTLVREKIVQQFEKHYIKKYADNNINNELFKENNSQRKYVIYPRNKFHKSLADTNATNKTIKDYISPRQNITLK